MQAIFLNEHRPQILYLTAKISHCIKRSPKISAYDAFIFPNVKGDLRKSKKVESYIFLNVLNPSHSSYFIQFGLPPYFLHITSISFLAPSL